MENVKVYNIKQIETACIIGSPIAAGILIAHNFKKWGNDRQAVNWIIIGIVWTVAILGISFLIPEGTLDKSLTFLPFINGAILYPIIKKYQGDRIDEHFENNGEKGSNWNVAVVIVIIAAVIMTPLILIEQNSPINKYLREDFNRNGVFYNQEMSLEEVEKLGNILKRVGYFNSDEISEVVFIKCDSIYELKLVSEKAYFNDSAYLNEMQSVFKHISYYDFDKPVRFNLIDQYLLKEKRIILNEHDSIPYLMETVAFIKNESFKLYYDIKIPNSERLKFQDVIISLNNLFPHQYEINFYIEIFEEAYSLSLYNPKANWENPQLLSEIMFLKNQLNRSNFSKPFRLFLYDETESGFIEKEIE